MTRLALSRTAVMSMSSFSLYPAIANPGKAFYPTMPVLFDKNKVRKHDYHCQLFLTVNLASLNVISPIWALLLRGYLLDSLYLPRSSYACRPLRGRGGQPQW